MGNKTWPCSRCIQNNRFHTVMIITSYFCTCDTNSLQLFPSLCNALTELISPRQSSHHMGVKLLHTGPLILLPTDCQHVLMPTEPHSSLGPDCFTLWLYSTSTWRCFFFFPLQLVDTKACPGVMHIIARRAAMRGFGSPVLSSLCATRLTGSRRLCTMAKLSSEQVVFNKPKVRYQPV